MTTPERDDNYRLLVESSWDDIHHARGQDWRALLVVAGVHIGILQGLEQASDKDLPFPYRTFFLIGALLALAFVAVGVLVTCRHYHLMRVKLGWIYGAEEKLGLVKSHDNDPDGILPAAPQMKKELTWKELRWPRLFSASWLIVCFYPLLAFIDAGAIVVCLAV